MALTIHNTSAIIAGDPRTIGAAIKIVLAGGTNLDTDQKFRVSGLSSFVWSSEAPSILRLVESLSEPEHELGKTVARHEY